jgi:phosphatidate phosphatase PAH1
LINGQKTPLVMKLGSAGEGFFVEKVENNEEKLEEN